MSLDVFKIFLRIRYKFAEDWKLPSSHELENSFISCISLRKGHIDIGQQISAVNMCLLVGKKKLARIVYLEKLSAMRKVRARLCARTRERNFREYAACRLTKIDKGWFYEPISATIQCCLLQWRWQERSWTYL